MTARALLTATLTALAFVYLLAAVGMAVEAATSEPFWKDL
jgi:hypothetical protein